MSEFFPPALRAEMRRQEQAARLKAEKQREAQEKAELDKQAKLESWRELCAAAKRVGRAAVNRVPYEDKLYTVERVPLGFFRSKLVHHEVASGWTIAEAHSEFDLSVFRSDYDTTSTGILYENRRGILLTPDGQLVDYSIPGNCDSPLSTKNSNGALAVLEHNYRFLSANDPPEELIRYNTPHPLEQRIIFGLAALSIQHQLFNQE